MVETTKFTSHMCHEPRSFHQPLGAGGCDIIPSEFFNEILEMNLFWGISIARSHNKK
jgi:hypothetical protein